MRRNAKIGSSYEHYRLFGKPRWQSLSQGSFVLQGIQTSNGFVARTTLHFLTNCDRLVNTLMPLSPGDKLGPYEVLSRTGAGGRLCRGLASERSSSGV